ncbi:MAG: hypothetical protein KJZ75_10835 [Hyphomonadaceae bacterium]|nr:hypothetical protein [Hyphomonadaceae bacterium]GIK48939.1 MAG: hypothetical protein BroJett013_16360 [Alphaproteobacteria bacterium]
MKPPHVLLAAALGAVSIGCTEPVEPPPDPEAAAQVGAAEPLPRILPPPSESQPRFVGLWATGAEGCAQPAWRFRRDGVSTLGEVSCSFESVSATPTGYDVAATCHAEGVTSTHAMQFSFAESARAMMIADGPWAGPTSLVYCGPAPAP